MNANCPEPKVQNTQVPSNVRTHTSIGHAHRTVPQPFTPLFYFDLGFCFFFSERTAVLYDRRLEWDAEFWAGGQDMCVWGGGIRHRCALGVGAVRVGLYLQFVQEFMEREVSFVLWSARNAKIIDFLKHERSAAHHRENCHIVCPFCCLSFNRINIMWAFLCWHDKVASSRVLDPSKQHDDWPCTSCLYELWWLK